MTADSHAQPTEIMTRRDSRKSHLAMPRNRIAIDAPFFCSRKSADEEERRKFKICVSPSDFDFDFTALSHLSVSASNIATERNLPTEPRHHPTITLSLTFVSFALK